MFYMEQLTFKLTAQKKQKYKIKTASEYQECRAFWKWAQFHPQISQYLIKHCNENMNKSWFNQALFAIGMRPGLPDYQYPVPNNKWLGLWIEMKKKGGKVKDNQYEWIEQLRKINHYATFAYGAEDAIKITLDYVKNKV
jgi:VRR-NUC domain